MPSVLVTGASGLLGRAALAAFEAAGWVATGSAWHRVAAPLVAIDLCDATAVRAALTAKYDLVVNCAAERHPDVCESEPRTSAAINVDAVWELAKACAAHSTRLIHISTDYLFDGTRAPYTEDAPTCPPNEYGRQKLRGEWAARAALEGAVVLRLPVLYGPTTDLSESAVTAFAAVALNAGKPATVDDWQIRVPTYTPDVAATLVRIGTALTTATSTSIPSGVYNYSSDDRITRYGLVQLFAELLGVPLAHVTRNPGAPPGAPRPYDCQLSTTKLKSALGPDGESLFAPTTPLVEGLRSVLLAVHPGKAGAAGT